MLEIINRLLARSAFIGELTSQLIKEEIIFISNTLEMMRDAKEISNDAYLEYGSIQGGLAVVSNLLEQGVSGEEIIPLLGTLCEKTKILDNKYPGVNITIESGKYGYSITSIEDK